MLCPRHNVLLSAMASATATSSGPRNMSIRPLSAMRFQRARRFSTSSGAFLPKKTAAQVPASLISSNIIYEYPLTRTFRLFKFCSLSSMGFATSLLPFMLTADASLPFVTQVRIVTTCLGTSALFSALLVAWLDNPFISSIRTLSNVKKDKSGSAELVIDGIQFETLTFTLHPRFTSVYDLAFLKDTQRLFATWELAKSITLAKPNKAGSKRPPEEVVAETMDAEGKVLGRWIVSWSEDGRKGTCRGEGKVQRFFDVRRHMLPP